jgi:hypothetical protein
MAEEAVAQQAEPESETVTVSVEPYEKPGKPQLSDEEVEKMDTLPPEDEIGRYAKDAQRRIKSLHIANQEWRRRVVQSNRDTAAATNLANQLYQENQQYKADRQRAENALIEQALQRADAQLAQAKQRFLAARQNNDPAQELAAQEEIARYVAEGDRLRLLRPSPSSKDGEAPAAASPAGPVAGAPNTPQPPPVSEGTKRWLGNNGWYGKPGEEEMTHFALGVHESLEKQGINENTNPKEYWGTIDRRLREKFPERFNVEHQPEKPVNGNRPVAVAAATRVNGSESRPQRGPRHITLTESQVKLARSFGLTNEQYAMQLVRDEQSEGGYHDIATKR